VTDVAPSLVAGITEAFVDAYGIAPESVQVFIHEVDHDNWAKARHRRQLPLWPTTDGFSCARLAVLRDPVGDGAAGDDW
jgi:hypothetical protein